MYDDTKLLSFLDNLQDGGARSVDLSLVQNVLYKKKYRSTNENINHQFFIAIFNSDLVPSNHRVFAFVCICYQVIQVEGLSYDGDLQIDYKKAVGFLEELGEKNHIRENKLHAYFSLQSVYLQLLIYQNKWEDLISLVEDVGDYIFNVELSSVQPCFMLTYPNILRFIFFSLLINFFDNDFVFRLSCRTTELFKVASSFAKKDAIKSFWEFCYSNRDLMVLLDFFRKNKENGGLSLNDYSMFVSNFPSSVFHVKSKGKDFLNGLVQDGFADYIINSSDR